MGPGTTLWDAAKRFGSVLLAVATTVGLATQVATLDDTVVRAVGLTASCVMTLGILLQVHRWRRRPCGGSEDDRRQWDEPRLLGVAGIFLGAWMFLLPSPGARGWWLLVLVPGFFGAAALCWWLVSTVSSDQEGAPSSQIQWTLSLRISTAFLAALVVVGLMGLDARTAFASLLPGKTPSTITHEGAAGTGDGVTPTVTSGPKISEPDTRSPTSAADESEGEQTPTTVSDRDRCELMLLSAAPQELAEVWLAELTHYGAPPACPIAAEPIYAVHDLYYLDGQTGGAYIGDLEGHGSFVFEPLKLQLWAMSPELDLAEVMGGAPVRRLDCQTGGDIVVVVDRTGRPGGVAVRDTKTSRAGAQQYVLVSASEVSAWWRTVERNGVVGTEISPDSDQHGRLPTSVADVASYC